MSGPQLAVVQAVLGTVASRPWAQLSWMILAKGPGLLMSQNSDTTLKVSSSPQHQHGFLSLPGLGPHKATYSGFLWTLLPLCSQGVPFLPQCVKHWEKVHFVGLYDSSVLCEKNDQRTETVNICPCPPNYEFCEGHSRVLAGDQEVPGAWPSIA